MIGAVGHIHWRWAWALTAIAACWSGIPWAAERGAAPVAVIRGVNDPGLYKALDALSPTLWQSSRPPQSETILRGRARRHQARLRQVLESEGYYDGKLTFEISWQEAKQQVVFDVAPGPPYLLGKCTVLFRTAPEADAEPAAMPPIELDIGLTPGAVARAEDILAAEKRIALLLTNSGYPFAQAYDRRVVVNHDDREAVVTYFAAPGAHLGFGPPRVEGLVEVRLETVLREIAWEEGAPYRRELLETTQERLQKTGLFSLVRLKPAAPEEAEQDRIPIIVELVERRHRSISLGLHYRTDEGPGAGAQWEHRNFMERGRRLRVQGQLTELEQSVGASYDVRRFQRPDQTLTLQLKAARLDPEPYSSRRIDLGAWVEREATPEWSIGMGPALRLSRVEEARQTQQYYLASFPMQITLDKRNDRMDPTQGFRMANRLTPFVDIANVNTHFIKDELTLSGYAPLGLAPGLTIATRLRIGVMGGAGIGETPADERFYAGGGGSIRGYAFQEVGPLDRRGDPTGGRSLTDGSIELRHRINDAFGIAAFVDGGMAHESVYPDFKDNVQWGAGLGMRYFTPIGPLRLDVAVPLNRRKELDSRVQFYISVGQAF